jgi:hypothetical protein
MPYGFCENATDITGLGRASTPFHQAGRAAALGYNPAARLASKKAHEHRY